MSLRDGTSLEQRMRPQKYSGNELGIIGSGILLFLIFWLYLTWILGYEMFVSDVRTYWQISTSLPTNLFHPWWVPGYSALIWLVRTLTFDLLPPPILMGSLSLVFFSISVYFSWQIFSGPFRLFLAGLFALFPFTGLTYSVYPIADAMAICLVVLVLFFMEKKEWRWYGLIAALALLTQKVAWFFIPLICVYVFIKYKEARLTALLVPVPLFLYYLAGAIYHHNTMWIFQWSVENLMTSRSSLPIFDGVFGLMMKATEFSKTLKAIIVAFVFGLCLFCVILSIYKRNGIGLCLALGVLGMLAVVNQYEIWVVVRYAKLLVFPLGAWLAHLQPERTSNRWVRLILMGILLISFLTNIGYGYYMAKLY